MKISKYAKVTKKRKKKWDVFLSIFRNKFASLNMYFGSNGSSVDTQT